MSQAPGSAVVTGSASTIDGSTHHMGVVNPTYYEEGTLRNEGFSETEQTSLLWSYDVPNDVKIDAETLLIVASTDRLLNLLSTHPARARLGTVVVDVEGASIAEFQINDFAHYSTAGANIPLGPMSIHAKQGWDNLGSGITLAAGEVLTVYITPTTNDPDGVLPFNVHVVGFGVDAGSGEDIPVSGVFRPVDNTASQVAYQIEAPAGGLKLKSLNVWASLWTNVFIRNLEVRLGSMSYWKLGNFHWQLGCSTPCRFSVPMQGLTLSPGERIEVRGGIWGYLGQIISVTLFGTKVPIGFTRARSVNR